MKHSQELGFDDEGRPVLITRAAIPYEEEHRQRVRKYLIMMSCRVPALLLAAWAYSVWQNGWISLGIVAISIPLPWMAVLIANDRPPRRAEEPRRYSPSPHATLAAADYPAIGPTYIDADEPAPEAPRPTESARSDTESPG
ncbi:hypothetical protein MCHIJ_43750 [Mycolicibacterium chitae]|uniref:Transmembrane protein n=1 Tax=Mycolicibacterium chitae TaxID=1792 RepID=A0A448I7R7_MYCCI|nr:DUF3099 domain-containing protein [Mycolicibacterium chitae]MCV7108036.1 DUF3099 domain-containing protein [Mycolicibacterium chitae]BBZ04938.1 hypothetical protein MCHIJ_43750 [Mycolicibacterium chitae]VEG48561.1 transmembrane protein [Mycolicibacterium chitae]